MTVVDDEALSWADHIAPRIRYCLVLGARPILASIVALIAISWGLSAPSSTAPTTLFIVTVALCVGSLRRPLSRLGHTTVPVQVSLDGTATGVFVVPRLLVLGGLALCAVQTGAPPGLLNAVVVTLVALVAELPARVLAFRAVPYALNVSDVAGVKNWPAVNPCIGFAATTTAILAGVAALHLPSMWWGALGFSALAVVACAAVAIDSLRRIRARIAFEQITGPYLEALSPAFLLHWEAPVGTGYQVRMWLPYLERLGIPFFVLLRDEQNMRDVQGCTAAPVIVRPALEQLDAVLVPSLHVAAYVNTSTKNVHLVRYSHLTHVQLNHGDSDKAPSYNPAFRLYDKNFVSGQAAIDRFRAGRVDVPDDFFTIVGRPQVSNLNVAVAVLQNIDVPTVLYAPTWEGFHTDSCYSSLLFGEQIIEVLLRRGWRVLFRPHPYSRKSREFAALIDRIIARLQADESETGRRHMFGKLAESEMSIAACMNAADLLISDVSSVVGDFLFSEKPYVMTALSDNVTEFRLRYPMSRGAYVVTAGNLQEDLSAALDQAASTDPLAGVRERIKSYYLGDFPRNGYGLQFERAMHDVVAFPDATTATSSD